MLLKRLNKQQVSVYAPPIFCPGSKGVISVSTAWYYWHRFGKQNCIDNAKTNFMKVNNEFQQSTPGPDPKKSQLKDDLTDASEQDVVNSQSDAQVTNDSGLSAQEAYDTPESEEAMDEKINNLRDALNSDSLPPLPDEEGNGIVN